MMRHYILAAIGLGGAVLFYLLTSADRLVFERNDVVKKENRSLLFVGDVMLGRYVETLMDKNGVEYPFNAIREFLSDYIVVGNLEGTIPQTHVKTPSMGFRFSFKERTAQVLSKENFSAVSLANNHGVDYGEEGWINTVNKLRSAGIVPFGHSGRTIGTYYETLVGDAEVLIYGINMITANWNEQEALNVTSQLIAKNNSKYVIAFMHWGNEYEKKQSNVQQEFAHKLIDLGVDTVIGTHSHVTQGIEIYKEHPIFYSMGNFIFDQYFSDNVERSYVISLSKKGDEFIFGIIPIVSKLSVPEVAPKKIQLEILADIIKSSDESLKSSITEGAIKIPYKI